MATFVSDSGVKSNLDSAQLFDLLAPVVGERYVLTRPEQLGPYECDGLSAYRGTPLAVVLPGTVGEVCEVMRLCSQHGVPVVARGAGTGLSGGALPYEHGILLGLSRFNRILSVDAENRQAMVQPGVRNLAISEAVSHLGLYYAPDPSSQIACSIGGNVAENAGGVHCLKYGLTVHNILALKVVTVDGELIQVGGSSLDTPGYDLLALMTGSEGLLGIVVEVTVRLLPRPASARAVLASFDKVETAGDAVASIISAGILPAGLEMMDNPAIRATEDFVKVGYPVDAAAILICELDGTEEEVDEQIRKVELVLLDHGATEVRLSQDEGERVRFWSGRKNAFPAVGRISPDYYCIDGTIPRRSLGRILRTIASLAQEYELAVANVFHAGDGNLHPLILYDANKAGEFERTEELGGRILEACVEVGGTITGEHGVGVEKINQMCVLFGDAELEHFHMIKSAFDPARLLNPGKAVPTLARCAEFNAMHVHAGQLPFPDIERF
jgi:glycolate oxidase